jgi:hypothetical protein
VTYQIPTSEPTEPTAGETWLWNLSLANYPTAEYSLAYALKGASAAPTVTVTENADGVTYNCVVAATATAALTAGLYQWIATITETATGLKHTIRRGVMNVRENLATATASKTHNEKMYDAICAALEGRTVADVESYSINGRALNRIPYAELERAKNKYAFAVWQERHPNQSLPTTEVYFPGVGIRAPGYITPTTLT